MMDFEGIEKVRQRVRQNGTLAQQLARMPVSYTHLDVYKRQCLC